MPEAVPPHISAIRREIKKFFNQKDEHGIAIGNSKFGVYAFYDYDGEPIYVGQTEEMLRARVGRHLTNQRTDAVAMNVLDPAEVAEIEVWPLVLTGLSTAQRKERLAAAEYTVFQLVVKQSALGAVLNEKDIPATALFDLPTSYRSSIVPQPYFDQFKHADIRIARRASTIANLARVISERDVSTGLRRTLLTQAKRLERLANKRLSELSGSYPVEQLGEETGENNE